jgi:hypothetical protein
MELTLKHAEMSRPILSFVVRVYFNASPSRFRLNFSLISRFFFSLPFAVGTMQGLVLERLPENLFTVTRSQVRPSSALLFSLSSPPHLLFIL